MAWIWRKQYKIFFEFEKEKLYKKTRKEALPKWSYYQNYQKILDSSSEYYRELYRSKLSVSQSDV